jgi:hypothetical protein
MNANGYGCAGVADNPKLGAPQQNANHLESLNGVTKAKGTASTFTSPAR